MHYTYAVTQRESGLVDETLLVRCHQENSDQLSYPGHGGQQLEDRYQHTTRNNTCFRSSDWHVLAYPFALKMATVRSKNKAASDGRSVMYGSTGLRFPAGSCVTDHFHIKTGNKLELNSNVMTRNEEQPKQTNQSGTCRISHPQSLALLWRGRQEIKCPDAT